MPKPKEIKIIRNETLPTLFVDNLLMSTRDDGLYLIQCMTLHPDGLREQSRMIIPKDKLKAMINLLCTQCDYFPVKPKAKAKVPSAGGAK